jgi:hypothetical protein
MANEVTRCWLCFDLGLRGEYDERYSWLDNQKAQECGDGVATFKTDKSRDEIKRELGKILGRQTKARIYLILLHKSGKFIFGSRKVAPWSGYGRVLMESGDET